MELSLFSKGSIIEWKGKWSVSDVKKHADIVFVFGDNDARKGHGGQAVIRDLPNAAGIRTKKLPSMHTGAFYTDDEYTANVKKMQEDLDTIQSFLQEGKTVVFSEYGYGAGLARMDQKAPKSYAYLVQGLKRLGHVPSRQPDRKTLIK